MNGSRNFNTVDIIRRTITATLLATILGVIIGAGTAHAEILVNVLAGQYAGYTGHAGAVSCTPLPSGMQQGGYGLSTNGTMAMYYMKSHAKIWHLAGYGPLLQAQNPKVCNNCSAAVTICIYSSANGDKLANQSTFQDVSGANYLIYYTSVPDNKASCYSWWKSGVPC